MRYIEEREYSEEKNVSYVTSFERFAMEKGHQEGLREGRQEGRQEGRIHAIREIIRNMLSAGVKKEEAAKFAKIDLNELEDLLKDSEETS
jgi:predicted transposase/invertase (TIGR01784 family)